jgi:glycosyltransferase involved in cell wall biosynthesis
MNILPNIGVVITAHNYGHYLAACLESIFAQTLLPRQVVVVDDASQDDTADVVAGFDHVHYCRVDFCNGNRSRNFGFLKVSEPLVAFFDADNVMLPHFLESLYNGLKKDPQAAFVYGDRINFADGDTSWYPLPMGHRVSGPFDVSLLKKSNYIDLAALIRADCFPGFDVSLKRYQDWDLWLNMVVKEGRYGHYVPEPLFRYRVHPQSVSYREDRDLAMWAIRKKYRLGWGVLPLLRHSFRFYQIAQKIRAQWVSHFA